MATAGQRIADLERQLAEQAAAIHKLRGELWIEQMAFAAGFQAGEKSQRYMVETFNEMRLRRQAEAAARTARPRHLHVIGRGAS
jgi:uncharacterized coiled-coil protein SlyX